ncbi:hypothetical protein VTO73DRAFT_8730 [Trametes versicolor]
MTQTVAPTADDHSSPSVPKPSPARPAKDPRDHFQEARPYPPSASNIYASSPEQLVDRALHALQEAGVELIEWKTLLFRRMGVPVALKNFHYLVPDAEFARASRILEEDEGLLLSLPPWLLLWVGGDFYSKAKMHRVTRDTSLGFARHLVLYPASFPAYLPSELAPQPRSTALAHPRCATVLVPSPPAVYAGILRMMRSYTLCDPARKTLASDLSELIGYHLYELVDGYVHDGDEERLEVGRRVEDAVRVVQGWRRGGEPRDEEGWIAEALEDVVSGKLDIGDIPWAEEP